MDTMKTEAEFVAERMKAHREACAGLDNDPIYQLAHPTPTVVSQRERDQYCFSEGWQLRRQAG